MFHVKHKIGDHNEPLVRPHEQNGVVHLSDYIENFGGKSINRFLNSIDLGRFRQLRHYKQAKCGELKVYKREGIIDSRIVGIYARLNPGGYEK
jgi:hypothetical protein